MLKKTLFSVLVSTSILAGCATVSVVPDNTTVETRITQEQSALRKSALAFHNEAISRGWIKESRGFIDLARVLVNGEDASPEEATEYADLIGTDLRDDESLISTISADTTDAVKFLSSVSTEAGAFLNAELDASTTDIRGDLVSFERTLVQAQQSRRSFVEAAFRAGLDQNADLTGLIERFDVEIDIARDLADRIAAQYSSRDVGNSVS